PLGVVVRAAVVRCRYRPHAGGDSLAVAAPGTPSVGRAVGARAFTSAPACFVSHPDTRGRGGLLGAPGLLARRFWLFPLRVGERSAAASAALRRGSAVSKRVVVSFAWRCAGRPGGEPRAARALPGERAVAPSLGPRLREHGFRACL